MYIIMNGKICFLSSLTLWAVNGQVLYNFPAMIQPDEDCIAVPTQSDQLQYQDRVSMPLNIVKMKEFWLMWLNMEVFLKLHFPKLHFLYIG